MLHHLARALAAPCVLVLVSGCMGGIDGARCDQALEGVAREQRAAAARDHQIAWLGWKQAELTRALGDARASADPDREALLRRIGALEDENAALTVRLGRAERDRAAAAAKRRLDETVPYDRRPVVEPRASDEDELVQRSAPRASRTLDEYVPYERHTGAARRASRAIATPRSTRRLDTAIPY